MRSLERIVRDRDTGEEARITPTDAELAERYGPDAKAWADPTPMFYRDKICERGVFPWSRYSRLSVRRVKS